MLTYPPNPMNTTRPIRVTLVDNPAKCWISLHGTLLVVKMTEWTGNSTIEIPVEISSTRMSRRLRASRLITAMLLPLLVPAITFAMLVLPYDSPRRWPDHAASGILIGGGILWLLAFFALFARFCIRQPTVIVDLKSQSPWIEFWLDKQHAPDILRLLADIRPWGNNAIAQKICRHPVKRHQWSAEHLPHPGRRKAGMLPRCCPHGRVKIW